MGAMTDMIYRINYSANLVAFIFVLVEFFSIRMLYFVNNNQNIVGYSVWEMCLVIGMANAVFSLVGVLCWWGMDLLAEQIYYGRLDYLLIKPVNSVFYVIFQRINFRDIWGQLFPNCILVGWSFWQLRQEINIGLVGGILFIIIFSLLLIFEIFFISSVAVFYLKKKDGLWPLINYTQDFISYPRKIYPKEMQMVLIYVWPLLLMVNPVYDLLKGDFNLFYIFRILLVLFVFALIGRWMWLDGLRRYESTG